MSGPQNGRHSLMTVHAHPDDETISTGGVMARYAAAGDRVICVTATGGEHGEIVVPEMDTPENHARLREIREEEITRALAQLGRIEHHWLGYVDSGMMGTPENEASGSFWQADEDEAAGRLVKLIRQGRPQVLVSYNDYGGYGHPDHIRTATTTKRAFERSGDPNASPEQLQDGLTPWQPLKLYETVFDMSRREEMAKIMEERGLPDWFTPNESESDEQRAQREQQWRRMRDATGPKTTSVDIADVLPQKLAALREHVTQLAKDSWFLALTVDDWKALGATEDFTLRVSALGVRIPETDLFAGLPPES